MNSKQIESIKYQLIGILSEGGPEVLEEGKKTRDEIIGFVKTVLDRHDNEDLRIAAKMGVGLALIDIEDIVRKISEDG